MRRLTILGVVLLLAACGSTPPEPDKKAPIAVTFYATTPALTPVPTQAAAQATEPPAATETPIPLSLASANESATATAAPVSAPSTPASAPEPAHKALALPAGGVEGMRALLLDLMNQERAKAGAAVLSISPILQQAAQLHAEDLTSTGVGSHTGSDGSTFQGRIKRAGYPGSVLNVNEAWVWQADAQGAHDWWMKDPEHGPIIQSQTYSEVGIGISPNASGGYFFVADFGSPSP